MSERPFADGSAGDVNYGVIGVDYAVYRKPDSRIAARILQALGDAETVLNVGAGAGSYEPRDRRVTAVEPSATMRAQRPPELPPAIDAVAEALPFPDDAFDAAMANSTVHQWSDLARGIAEMIRVSLGPVVITVSDPERLYDPLHGELVRAEGRSPGFQSCSSGGAAYPVSDQLNGRPKRVLGDSGLGGRG